MNRKPTRRDKPLFELRKPLRAKIFRARIRPFETTKYLNWKALAAAKKATIECGTVEVAGRSVMLSAEIRRGIVIRLQPHTCTECGPELGRRRAKRPAMKELAREVTQRLAKQRVSLPTLPVPLGVSKRARDPIVVQLFGNAIVIVVVFCDDGSDQVCDICASIAQTDGSRCVYCIVADNYCF